MLVLDEPTNDLDLETLELLEELLADYQGTVLLVSHDREFLNNVVSSTLDQLQGDGQVKESAGGYDDATRANAASTAVAAETAKPSAKPASAPSTAERPRKLNYQEKRELDTLPATIAKLETEQQQLHETLADPSFYRQAGPQIAETKSRLSAVDDELLKAYARWEELEKG